MTDEEFASYRVMDEAGEMLWGERSVLEKMVVELWGFMQAERAEVAQLQKWHEGGRWNADESDGVLSVCFGEHESGQSCEFARYVPEGALNNLRTKVKQLPRYDVIEGRTVPGMKFMLVADVLAAVEDAE